MRPFRARLLALLALLLVALPLGAGGSTRYLCRAMGRVMDSCCCPKAKAAHGAQAAVTTVKAPDCCSVLERAGHEGTPAVLDGAPRVPTPELALATSIDIVVLEPGLYLLALDVVQARGPPPRPGPPLFLKNCSLLT